MFYMSIHSGDIRDRSRTLSEIAFCGPLKFQWRDFQKLYPHYHPSLAARDLEKFREGTPTIREVLREHMLNFGQVLHFRD